MLSGTFKRPSKIWRIYTVAHYAIYSGAFAWQWNYSGVFTPWWFYTMAFTRWCFTRPSRPVRRLDVTKPCGHRPKKTLAQNVDRLMDSLNRLQKRLSQYRAVPSFIFYKSRFSTCWALFSINLRRGSTSSPVSRVSKLSCAYGLPYI